MATSDTGRERERYDERAEEILNGGLAAQTFPTEAHLRAPYDHFRRALESLGLRGQVALELGAGDGVYTQLIAQTGANVLCLDVSSQSLRVNRKRVDGEFRGICADMAAIPLADSSVDAVISAGSLSYGDPLLVDAEIFRVLRPGGSLLVVDSLNHNPFYRLNRRVGYFRGRRTKSTIHWMPQMRRIDSLRTQFDSSDAQFFGTWAFLHPLTKGAFGQARADATAKWLQTRGPSRYAFKFVLCATGFHPRRINL